jgi:phosphomannomutase / phosphoglucomutase
MKFPKSIFREYDIRGIAGKDLSAELSYELGLVYAELVHEKGSKRSTPLVSVGRDCRLSSDEYADALINGLRDGGLDVVSLGVCPSPLTYFSIFKKDLDGGIMVTGSHNPADYNGFKIGLGKDTLHGNQIQDIRARLEKGAKKHAKKGALSSYDVIPDYWDELKSRAKPLTKMKIVIDAGNGTAATVAPELFRRLGAEVIELFCELDGRFPNHHPDPTVVKNLKVMIDTVIQQKADFGVAFDGDSDRIGLVDEKGTVIFGDEMMVLFSRDVLNANPGATIISEVKSSYRLYDDIAKRGGVPIMWKTGHSLIKSKMKESKALLAGEMSGHIFFADRYYGYDDAIYAALRVYEIVSAAAKPLSSLLSDLDHTVNTPEIRIDCVEELKFQLVEETKKNLEGAGKINPIDGIRIDFGDGWGLVRASNTQPVIVLRFEASSEKQLLKIRQTVEGALGRAAEKLGHPPLKEESSH